MDTLPLAETVPQSEQCMLQNISKSIVQDRIVFSSIALTIPAKKVRRNKPLAGDTPYAGRTTMLCFSAINTSTAKDGAEHTVPCYSVLDTTVSVRLCFVGSCRMRMFQMLETDLKTLNTF